MEVQKCNSALFLGFEKGIIQHTVLLGHLYIISFRFLEDIQIGNKKIKMNWGKKLLFCLLLFFAPKSVRCLKWGSFQNDLQPGHPGLIC